MAGASTFGMMLRLFVSLAVVIALMMGVVAVLRRRGLGGFSPGRGRRNAADIQVEVLARKPLSKNASIAVVRAGSKSMVLGITESTVTMLSESEIDLAGMEEEALEGQGTGLPFDLSGSSQTWKTMLDNLRDKTVRRA
jgi:flagellar biogenesis protein FliO